jgi:hypothetical protein
VPSARIAAKLDGMKSDDFDFCSPGQPFRLVEQGTIDSADLDHCQCVETSPIEFSDRVYRV